MGLVATYAGGPVAGGLGGISVGWSALVGPRYPTYGGGPAAGGLGGLSVSVGTVKSLLYLRSFSPGVGMLAQIGLAPSPYLQVLQQLLPTGKAWTRDQDAELTALLEALSYEPGRVDLRAQQLLLEAIPSTAVELLPDWLEALGLAGNTSLITQAQQQAAAGAQFAARGGASIPFWVSLAATLGYAITIETYPTMGCNHPCNLALSVNYQWMVTTASGACDSFLQSLFDQYAPCHTEVLFTIT